MSEDRATYTLHKPNTTAPIESIVFPQHPPTDVMARRHSEIMATLTHLNELNAMREQLEQLLRLMNELLADHAAEHARYTPDHR